LEVKEYIKESKKLGIKKLNFAIYGHLVVAAHPDLQVVREIVKKVIPVGNVDSVVFGKI